MQFNFEIQDISELTPKLVNAIYTDERINMIQSEFDEVDFIWEELCHLDYQYFENREEFEIWLSELDNKSIDTLLYLIHTEKYDDLMNFLDVVTNEDATIDSFDNIFFKFLNLIKDKDTLHITVNKHIIIGGKNWWQVRKLKKELLKLEGIILLHSLWKDYKRIYVFLNTK